MDDATSHDQESDVIYDERIIDPIVTLSATIEEGAVTLRASTPKGSPPETWSEVPMKITTKVSMRIGPTQLALGSAALAGVSASLHRSLGSELRIEAAIRRAQLGVIDDPFLPRSSGGKHELPTDRPFGGGAMYDVRSLVEGIPVSPVTGLQFDDGFPSPEVDE